ncbi:hypothetical protein [Chryseolinea lacunae]|uniref:Lipoprotein n=1 Tax=Chryseolinea lacunae TaxID=2801331 RepID=A0ABS1KQA1_9BACT|nr:hypothetical protein [Chryseolinea lacunae]MBL0740466.1 hypothetical protein [Chryseolinea lacunae]
MKSTFETFRNLTGTVIKTGALALLIVVASCSKDDNNEEPVKPDPKVELTIHPTLGNYLTDGDGNTLYYFSNDVAGANTCTGGCATNWPIFFEDALTQDFLGEGLSLDDFASITTPAGKQTTYKGWPLYYYAPGGVREAANQQTGEAVGGVWFVAKPDYTIMIGRAQLVGQDGKNYNANYEEGTGAVAYFTDAHGRTIYSFAFDKKDKNNYTNGDGSHDAVWPIYSEALEGVPSTLDLNLFGTITVSGAKQLTYKGWPLYYFGNDAKRGDNKGVSVPQPGVWPVAVKDADEAPL